MTGENRYRHHLMDYQQVVTEKSCNTILFYASIPIISIKFIFSNICNIELLVEFNVSIIEFYIPRINIFTMFFEIRIARDFSYKTLQDLMPTNEKLLFRQNKFCQANICHFQNTNV